MNPEVIGFRAWGLGSPYSEGRGDLVVMEKKMETTI